MDARAQTVAAALAAWRETEAQNRDRPRKWIIDDDAIYRMAERLPDSRAQLEALGTLPPKTVERHGESLLALIRSEEHTSELQSLMRISYAVFCLKKKKKNKQKPTIQKV